MGSESPNKIAIEVRDVTINYRILNNVSVRRTFLRKKVRNEIFEAVKHVSFSVEESG